MTDKTIKMYKIVNNVKIYMVIHFRRCEVKTIHVGRCKVSEGLKQKCSSQAQGSLKVNDVMH